MLEALGWGLLASSSLVIGSLIAIWLHLSLRLIAFVLAFAGGAILTMLANTMMPEAYERGGKLVGVVTTLGFAVAYTIHMLG